MNSTKKFVVLGLLVSQALVLHIIEGFLPIPFIAPGAKLGLANIVTLSTIILLGFKEALIVLVLRSVLGNLLAGTVSSLLFSLTGGILSTIVMALLYRFKDTFSIVAISVAGAVFHNIGQLFAAAVIINNFGIFVYLPILLITGVATGVFIGLVTKFLNKYINNRLFRLF
ncbi:MAG TPA: Gx transporter family protein [Clostridiales bacterium]|jgi:heptaprenyl diphosphate synthase|nr:Gx transporter family protein [Clostridiales bacterium]